jgi:hypothetical protein
MLPTITGLLLAQAASGRPGLAFEDKRWTWREHAAECTARSAGYATSRATGYGWQHCRD